MNMQRNKDDFSESKSSADNASQTRGMMSCSCVSVIALRLFPVSIFASLLSPEAVCLSVVWLTCRLDSQVSAVLKMKIVVFLDVRPFTPAESYICLGYKLRGASSGFYFFRALFYGFASVLDIIASNGRRIDGWEWMLKAAVVAYSRYHPSICLGGQKRPCPPWACNTRSVLLYDLHAQTLIGSWDGACQLESRKIYLTSAVFGVASSKSVSTWYSKRAHASCSVCVSRSISSQALLRTAWIMSHLWVSFEFCRNIQVTRMFVEDMSTKNSEHNKKATFELLIKSRKSSQMRTKIMLQKN
jgi:hypothetical protein